MINRLLVIDGRCWGRRLAERLRQPPMLEEFLDSYLRKSAVDRSTLVRLMQPHLQKLRGRHLHKYGVESHPLL